MAELALRTNQISFDEGRKSLASMLRWHFEAYNKLMSALSMTSDYRSLLKICEEGRERYGSRPNIAHIVPSMTFFKDAEQAAMARQDRKRRYVKQERFSREETQVRLECGDTSHLAYPFTPEKYRNRGRDLIESTKSLFREASSICMLGYSPVAPSSNTSEESSSKSLGVFATQNIPFGKRLIEDTTILAASTVSAAAPSTLQSITNSPRICENCYGSIPTLWRQDVLSECCNTSYCSARCRDMAHDSYHKVLCGQNFDWLYQESQGKLEQFVLNGPMWLRILATCVQSKGHPLDHPSIARLTPLHDKMSRIWTFSNNIVTPIRILKQLGIDPMQDFRYDTWVLQTIWTRVINNQEEHTTPDGRQVRAISPFYSFFNHSCDPNTSWSPTDGPTCTNGSTKDIFANRPIRKGEELCISYGKFSDHSKAERQKILQSWIGSDRECACTKCQRGDR